jgi:hypothetical protein
VKKQGFQGFQCVRSSFSPESQKKVGFLLFDRKNSGLSTGIIKIVNVMGISKTASSLEIRFSGNPEDLVEKYVSYVF